MSDLPYDKNTPFSLPDVVKRAMPEDYAGLDSNLDSHEAYDEGMDNLVDVNPYRFEPSRRKAAGPALSKKATKFNQSKEEI